MTGRRGVGVAASPVGYGVSQAGAPGVGHPRHVAAAGPRPRAEAAQARRQGEVELVEVDGDDLARSDDVVVADALVEPVGFRRQVEYRRRDAVRASLTACSTQHATTYVTTGSQRRQRNRIL